MPMRSSSSRTRPEFARLDLHRLKQTMRFPIVIDGRNLHKPPYMLEHGFTYASMGRPATYAGSVGKQHKRTATRSDLPPSISVLQGRAPPTRQP